MIVTLAVVVMAVVAVFDRNREDEIPPGGDDESRGPGPLGGAL